MEEEQIIIRFKDLSTFLKWSAVGGFIVAVWAVIFVIAFFVGVFIAFI